MTKKHTYKLVVEPADGVNLKSSTLREWVMGQMFKVRYSSSPLFRTNSYISNVDITEQEVWHNSSYHIDFVYQSVADHIKQMEEA